MAAALTPEQTQQLQDAFNLFDVNHDGKIDASELTRVMINLGQKPTEQEVRDMIHDVDTDGNGTVDFEEFVQMMSKTMTTQSKEAQLKNAFDIFDADHDGFITAEELKRGMAAMGETLTAADIKSMILDADMNDDGKIDFAEFCRMMKD
ncbi:calmodulin D [Pelomyxa schiedti]|nr:calmodulin D [Pelomyxa schiedti]